jgi:hypothetical protein
MEQTQTIDALSSLVNISGSGGAGFRRRASIKVSFCTDASFSKRGEQSGDHKGSSNNGVGKVHCYKLLC